MRSGVGISDLTDHFTTAEHACNGCNDGDCGKFQKLHPKLYPLLEELRAVVERPLPISSGYRCESHNERVGGSKNSQHLHGCAVDIRLPNRNIVHEVALEAVLCDFKGFGLYDTWLHLDLRESDTIALWGSALTPKIASQMRVLAGEEK